MPKYTGQYLDDSFSSPMVNYYRDHDTKLVENVGLHQLKIGYKRNLIIKSSEQCHIFSPCYKYLFLNILCGNFPFPQSYLLIITLIIITIIILLLLQQ